MITRVAVESASIVSLGYATATKTLEVEFVNGSVYRYFGVGPAVHQAFLAAASKGQFFNRYVRDAYAYTKVE